MTDEEPTGSCVTCFRRDPLEGYVCRPCRSKFRTWLTEIPDLWGRLLGEPLEPSSAQGKGGPISGSRERPLPIRVDLFDLTHLGAGERIEGMDQVGHAPVWMTLETWVSDWLQYRDRGEHGPHRSVEEMCRWMRERVDDMCDNHPAVDEAFHDVRRLRGVLRSELGEVDPQPEYIHGVPCKSCNARALWRMPESEYAAECGACDNGLMTETEYMEWVVALAPIARRILRSERSAA